MHDASSGQASLDDPNRFGPIFTLDPVSWLHRYLCVCGCKDYCQPGTDPLFLLIDATGSVP